MGDSVGNGFPQTGMQEGHIHHRLDEDTAYLYIGNGAIDVNWIPISIYNYRSVVVMQDDFLTGNATAGSIGSLGWGSSGTLATITSPVNHPGCMNISTGAVSATLGRISMAGNSLMTLVMSPRLIFTLRLNSNDVNTSMHIGLTNNAGIFTPTDGVYFEKLDADTNWFCNTRIGSVETRQDTGVPVSTSFITMRIIATSTLVTFIINDVVVAISITNLPTLAMGGMVQIINSAALAKTVDVDYVEIMLGSISR